MYSSIHHVHACSQMSMGSIVKMVHFKWHFLETIFFFQFWFESNNYMNLSIKKLTQTFEELFLNC